MKRERAAVLGAGSWGTALAKVLADQGLETALWARHEAHANAIEKAHVNERYLPDIKLPSTLRATGSLEEALDHAQLVVLAVPSHALRALAVDVRDMLPDRAPIVNAAKGIENESLELMSQVLEGTLPARLHPQLTFLSGPSFAKEVAVGIPTAVCIAGKNEAYTTEAQHTFTTPRLRVYSTDDVIGVELGGALKNVVAIAAGAADGLAFGHNSRAALITRGLAEIARMGNKLGAHPLTLAGLAGMGDLVLTCTGDLSRNRHVGIELGRGRKLEDILGEMTMVAEGVRTAKSAYELSRREGVEMPLVEQVYSVLYEGKPAALAVEELMSRAPRPERDF